MWARETFLYDFHSTSLCHCKLHSLRTFLPKYLRRDGAGRFKYVLQKVLRWFGAFPDTTVLHLDFPNQHVALSEHLCMLYCLVSAHDRSYWELLRASHAEAGAFPRETECPGRCRLVCVCDGRRDSRGTEVRDSPTCSAGPWVPQAVRAPGCCSHRCTVQVWRQIPQLCLQSSVWCWCRATEAELHCSACAEN